MSETTFTLDSKQQEACELIGSAHAGIVTGGPGTGKTTTLKAALAGLPKPKIVDEDVSYYDRGEDEGRPRMPDPQVALCAPTGKAARRMREATGWPAQTLHRLLGYTGTGFRRGPQDPLNSGLVLIDESSMIDTLLAAQLFRALRPTTRLVLVGDANQLPSVGPGQVLADLIACGRVPTVRLETLHRAAQQSWICRNAPHVIAGRELELDETDDFQFVEAEGSSAAADLVVEGVSEWQSNHADLHGELQVLIPMHKGDVGVSAVNQRLQDALCPKRGKALPIRSEMQVWEGDRVINCRNNYKLGVFNGEIGRVLAVNESGLEVDFEGHSEKVVMSKLDAYDLELAYALTIHKSQGSEWPWVMVVCHSAHQFMLSRQLIYTALTRAKKGVILVGNTEGLYKALQNNRPAERRTRLQEALRA